MENLNPLATTGNSTPLLPFSGLKSALCFLVPEVRNSQWVQMTVRWSRYPTSVPVDEAAETDRDQVEAVSVFALCLVGAEVVDRAACPPSPPPPALTELDRPQGLTDDAKETGERDWEREVTLSHQAMWLLESRDYSVDGGFTLFKNLNNLTLNIKIFLFICYLKTISNANHKSLNLIRYCCIHTVFLSLGP